MRISRLSENVLDELYKGLRSDIDALKTTQTVDAPNIKLYQTTIDPLAVTVAAFDVKRIIVNSYQPNSLPGGENLLSLADLSFRIYTDANLANEIFPTDTSFPIFSDDAASFYPSILFEVTYGGQFLQWSLPCSNLTASSKTWYIVFTVQSFAEGVVEASA